MSTFKDDVDLHCNVVVMSPLRRPFSSYNDNFLLYLWYTIYQSWKDSQSFSIGCVHGKISRRPFLSCLWEKVGNLSNSQLLSCVPSLGQKQKNCALLLSEGVWDEYSTHVFTRATHSAWSFEHRMPHVDFQNAQLWHKQIPLKLFACHIWETSYTACIQCYIRAKLHTPHGRQQNYMACNIFAFREGYMTPACYR